MGYGCRHPASAREALRTGPYDVLPAPSDPLAAQALQPPEAALQIRQWQMDSGPTIRAMMTHCVSLRLKMPRWLRRWGALPKAPRGIKTVIKRAADQSLKPSELAPATVDLDSDRAWCGACGAELELVRPGKYQHSGRCPADQA